jgi:hypothetical protein
VLTVNTSSGTAANLNLSGTYSTANFSLTDDGNGGTFLTYQPSGGLRL